MNGIYCASQEVLLVLLVLLVLGTILHVILHIILHIILAFIIFIRSARQLDRRHGRALGRLVVCPILYLTAHLRMCAREGGGMVKGRGKGVTTGGFFLFGLFQRRKPETGVQGV